MCSRFTDCCYLDSCPRGGGGACFLQIGILNLLQYMESGAYIDLYVIGGNEKACWMGFINESKNSKSDWTYLLYKFQFHYNFDAHTVYKFMCAKCILNIVASVLNTNIESSFQLDRSKWFWKQSASIALYFIFQHWRNKLFDNQKTICVLRKRIWHILSFDVTYLCMYCIIVWWVLN